MPDTKIYSPSIDPEKHITDAPKDEDLTVGNSQELKKPFSVLSTLGLNFSITSTPLSIGTYLSVTIGIGGSPGFFFGFIFAALSNLLVCFSLAEISAIYPHASGQIWWTAVLAPKKYSRGLSYLTGWATASGWFFWTAASYLITSQLIWALVQVCQTTFIIQPWHYYLGYLACGIVAFIINVPLFGIYPLMLKGLVGYINIGALFILITLLVRTHPKQSASFVFVDFVNLTGWSSNGVVFFLGLLPGAVAVNGFDCAAHMSEEMPRPARQVPQVMVGSALLSVVTGLVMILVYMFSNSQPDNLLTPIGGQPIAQLMQDSFDSLALTIIGLLVFIIVFLCAAITELTTFSRVWWSFAREGGVPFSGYMSRISSKQKLPVVSIVFCSTITALIGLLELGSATALNAILGTGVICIYISYTIPIACLILKRRSPMAEKHYFNLGSLGFFCNVVGVVWMLFEIVWLCFPLYLPIDASTMNYAVVVMAGTALVAGLNWLFYSKQAYRRPGQVEESQQVVIGEF